MDGSYPSADLSDVDAAEVVRPRALCVDSDPDLWFSDDPADWASCRAVCAVCPVFDRCLVGALRRRESWGLWAGVVFPATVRSCTPIKVADSVEASATHSPSELLDEPLVMVWRLRWRTGRGETVEFGRFDSRAETVAAADLLLGGLRREDPWCAA